MNIPRLAKDTVNYVAFSPADMLPFDPDLLILTAKPFQAEALLRATGYRSREAWNAKGTSVLGCGWLYIYPFVGAKINVMITEPHHGMKVRKVFPEGLLLISIPFDSIPGIVDALGAMEWDLPQFSWGKEKHLKKMEAIAREVAEEMKK